jgi:hypothetical protein
MRPITIAGAGSAFVILLLAFAMIGASNVALPEPNILASTDPTRETISVSDAKPFNPNNPRITDEDNRQTHVPTEGHERNFFRVASQQSELLPTEKSSSQVAGRIYGRCYLSGISSLKNQNGARCRSNYNVHSVYSVDRG